MNVGCEERAVACCEKQRFYYRIKKNIKQAWHGYRRWTMLNKQCRQLLEMENYLLRDIGISRADAVRFSRQRDSLWTCIAKSMKSDLTHSD
nr:DUF1127 domain-containing protein [uncultured Desulfobacter sp.]